MERRKYKRVKNDLDIKVKVNKNNFNVLEKGKSLNLSACGVLINYNKPLEIGENINVTFTQPGGNNSFESQAKVVRVELNPDLETYDIGIEFIGLSDDNEKKLDEFIQISEQEANDKEDNNENCYYIEIELPSEENSGKVNQENKD